MENPKAKEKRPSPAQVQTEHRRDIDVREILGMRHLWVVDTDDKRREPKLTPGE